MRQNRGHVKRATPGDLFPLPATVLAAMLATFCWLVLWTWASSPYSRFLAHGDLTSTGRPAVAVLVFTVGWTLMATAMMLPASFRLIELFDKLTTNRSDRRLLLGLLLTGFVSVWALFGVTAHAGDAVVHWGVAQSAWMSTHAWLLTSMTLLLAGLYQFSSIKDRCLSTCRAPFGLITQHWRGERYLSQSLLLGMHHGISCVGCCWPLMLVMFATGLGSPGWMLLLTVPMVTERAVTWGKAITRPLGLVLMCSAVLIAAREMALP